MTEPTVENNTSSQLPRVRPRVIVDKLIERGLLNETDLIGMLGEARHHLTIAELERALIRDSILSDTALAEVKGETSGYRYVTDHRLPTKPILDEGLARSAGAVVLDADPLTVILVEDLPETMKALEQALGSPFEVVVCTVAQFIDLHRATYQGASVSVRTPLGDIYSIFDEALRRRASDIHVSAGIAPILRIDGTLVETEFEPVDLEWMRGEIARIAGAQRLLDLENSHDVDMAFPYGSSRFRINFGADKRGFTMAARKIPTRIPQPEEIGLPASAQALVGLDRGLVLVTGPTGSGKSTTLAALLSTIVTRQSRHVITLEDPIEFILPHGQGVTHQREMGVSFSSFADGLRQALRQDPDVVLVGEMRDQETIRTALNAAETGHLVFGTLHTFDAPSTVTRIVSTFPAEEQDQVRSMLSYILKATISQTLLKHASGSGRVAAYEVMLSNHAVANNLKKIDGHAQLRQTIETSSRDGMQTMDMALADLVRRQLVLEKDALEKVVDADDFQRRLSN